MLINAIVILAFTTVLAVYFAVRRIKQKMITFHYEIEEMMNSKFQDKGRF